MDDPVAVGLVGCGNVSAAYFEACKKSDALRLTACADLDKTRAASQAVRFGAGRVLTPEELLVDPQVEIVLDLTPPPAHAGLNLAALEAGKHVYSEKPLARTRSESRRLLELAAAHDLRIGCAPDTFLGAGLQRARQLVDEGAIGAPLAAIAFMACHGHEHWHPDPAFYYEPGGGPLFDMGPYYLTALCTLLGPVRRVSGAAKTSAAERKITRGPHRGRTIPVRTETHVTATIDFVDETMATLLTSFDVWGHGLPSLEIYGTGGSLQLPDPNMFGGPLRQLKAGEEEWTEVELAVPAGLNARGIGLAEMATAIRAGRPHRASGELADHVLEVMEGIVTSAREGRHVEITSTIERPAPLELPES